MLGETNPNYPIKYLNFIWRNDAGWVGKTGEGEYIAFTFTLELARLGNLASGVVGFASVET